MLDDQERDDQDGQGGDQGRDNSSVAPAITPGLAPFPESHTALRFYSKIRPRRGLWAVAVRPECFRPCV